MSYFSKFPLVAYNIAGKESIVKDILRRVVFLSEHKTYTDMYEPYTIIDGETPQSVAAAKYGSSFYHWVILLFNEIHNPYFDWPLDIVNLEKLCADTYGESTMYMVRHYELNDIIVGQISEFNKDVTWIPPAVVNNAVPVSFYEYEQGLNDSKRSIKLLRPELLGEFVKQFEASLNG
jgi:hypothetical protein